MGKSSYGWKFGIEIHEEYYKDFRGFQDFINKPEIKIVDEYGDYTTPMELFQLIQNKKKDKCRFDDYSKDTYADCEEADLIKGEFN